MSSNDVVISVKNLSKYFEIYDRPVDRLKQILFPRIQSLMGRTPKQYFREFWALNDLSFEIKRGETVGIVGRNGSGKSTLLQMICGILTPTNGSIEITGRVAALLELGSGFNPEFSGLENVYMYASVLGLRDEEITARLDEILEFANIGDFIKQPVKNYSSGMVVRLAFAVIAHVDADILVIDEALAVGDAFFTQKCMRFLRKFMENGTVLFVSHDTAAVLNLCNSAFWLEKGNLRLRGDPKNVSEKYLEAFYHAQQEVSFVKSPSNYNENLISVSQPMHDMRMDWINQTAFRNDIEIFSFSLEGPCFGKGGVSIKNVYFTNDDGKHLSWLVGGELVRLYVEGLAHEQLLKPIVGFMVKDRLGQTIFADNTYLTYIDSEISFLPGNAFSAEFFFKMPILPVGDYTISIAVAEGTQAEHVQQCWMHEALAFKVNSSIVCHGLVGIPMFKIELIAK